MSFAQAARYVESGKLRAAVLSRVRDALPAQPGAEIVLIGHSLGSLVAIDPLDQLDERVTVVRLVTLGSPAGIRAMHKGSDRLLKAFPYRTVQSWVNVVSVVTPCAPVAASPATFLQLKTSLSILGRGARRALLSA